jgi:hypothetical protein
MEDGLKIKSNKDGIKKGFRMLYKYMKSYGRMKLKVVKRM